VNVATKAPKGTDGFFVIERGESVADVTSKSGTDSRHASYRSNYITLKRVTKRPRGSKLYEKPIAQFFTVGGLLDWLAGEGVEYTKEKVRVIGKDLQKEIDDLVAVRKGDAIDQ
jgi:hypothetical protein